MQTNTPPKLCIEARDFNKVIILPPEMRHDVIEKNSGRHYPIKYANAFNHDVNQSEDIFAIQITKQTGENEMTNLYVSENNGGRGWRYRNQIYLFS
jgi:hypothetical protein